MFIYHLYCFFSLDTHTHEHQNLLAIAVVTDITFKEAEQVWRYVIYKSSVEAASD